MADSPFWVIWPGNAALSALVWFLMAMPFLYAARKPVHELLRAVGQLAGGPLRMGSRWLLGGRAGDARAQQARSSSRTGATKPSSRSRASSSAWRCSSSATSRATRPCSAGCWTRSRGSRRTTRSAAKCRRPRPTGSRPSPPWPRSSPTATSWWCGSSRRSTARSRRIHDKTLAEYRRAYEARHKILDGFMPFWRSLDKTLTQADRKMTSLADRAASIDAQMERFEQIVKKTDRAEHCAHGVGADAVLRRHAGARHRRRRRADQLQADRAADVGNGGRGRLPHGLAAHLGSRRAGDHLRRSDHGAVPHGNAEDHAPLSEDPRAARAHARAHDVDRVRAAGDAGRHRGGTGADARHADRGQAGAPAVARRRRRPRRRRTAGSRASRPSARCCSASSCPSRSPSSPSRSSRSSPRRARWAARRW